MKTLLYLICFFLTLSSQASAVKNESFLFGKDEPKQVVVNNCILAKVNGKVISVIDIMKKMDMMFYKQYPEYASIPEARFQFYQVNWKFVLEDLIDKELILADAEENKLPVSNGDVRQEMESIFGPNIIMNLDKVGLSYDEALKLVHDDITIRRMMYIRVNSKAIKQVTPQDVRVAYDQYAKDNVRQSEWTYYVMTIRDPDAAIGAQASKLIHDLLNEKTPFETLAQKVKDENLLGATTTLSVSQEYKHSEKEISEANKEALSKLNKGEHGSPISQKSKADSSLVYRIFYLKDMQQGGVVPFGEVSETIKDKLIDAEAEKETDSYLKKLRKHFDIQDGPLKEMLSAGFQPFSIK